MTAHLARLFRHPVKGVGREPLDAATLAPDRPLPGDRAWAVLQEGGTDTGAWQPCTAFLRGVKAPSLMAVSAASHPGGITFTHPDRPDITLDPAQEGARLIDWMAPLCPPTRPAPIRLVRAPPEGMSDAPFASISVLNLASLRALEGWMGRPLDPARFRGNLWLEGLAPWAETAWTGRHLRIGAAALEITGPITRCRATEADPATGVCDAAVLAALESGWGHREFGVYARVRRGGRIAVGDPTAVGDPAAA